MHPCDEHTRQNMDKVKLAIVGYYLALRGVLNMLDGGE